MLNYDYFLAVNGGVGSDTLIDVERKSTMNRLRQQLMSSIHYDPRASRNENQQGVIITSGENPYKCKIEALPGDDLCTGDLVHSGDNYWIIWRIKITNPFQKIGTAWLCNHKFRWQNGTSKIIERWGVFDSGVYSSTRDGDKTVMTADKQFKVLLPYDRDTRRLNMDKRLAIGTIFNKEMREVLNVQHITGIDPVSSSYGVGGHLLVLNTRSDDFVGPNDNIEKLICDYIPPEDNYSKPVFKGIVSGSKTIRLGTTRTYAADFDVSEWQVSEIQGVTIYVEGNAVSVETTTDEDLLGEEISIAAIDADGNYARMFAEVVN